MGLGIPWIESDSLLIVGIEALEMKVAGKDILCLDGLLVFVPMQIRRGRVQNKRYFRSSGDSSPSVICPCLPASKIFTVISWLAMARRVRAVQTKRHTRNCRGIPLEVEQGVAGAYIPNFCGPVLTASDDTRPFRAERHAGQHIVMPV